MTAPSGTESSARARPTSSIVSLTGISSGVATTLRLVTEGSESSSTIQSVCSRTMPTETSSWIARGASSWPMMWPVAAASTTTRSQSARPSIDSRTSQHTLPTVRISFTPGAAVATNSSTRASGPSRPNTGTRG